MGLKKVAGEFVEFFTELMFGSGAWIGMIVICALILVIAAINKHGGIIAMPIGVLLGITYFQHELIWQGIITFFCGIIVMLASIHEVGKKK